MTRDWQEAVARGAMSELAALLSRGADIDARDRHGQTALMLAAMAGDARVVEWLASHGADLDHTAKFGLSALMLAAVRGHGDVVRVLVAAGAAVELTGTGAPGFAGKSAHDLAVERGDADTAALLQPLTHDTPPDPLPRFLAPATWAEAAALLTFVPRAPADTRGRALVGLRVHVRDHRRRDLPRHLRTLEAHYDGFAVCQSCPGASAARRRALDVRYGSGATPIRVAGHEGRGYPLGPEVPPDDIDGRSAAVVTWPDGPMFHFVASTQLPLEDLERIATSLYPAP
ncbi:MAG: ankyrin repeat domain-containing protein [Vicinamibacterales bacterium]